MYLPIVTSLFSDASLIDDVLVELQYSLCHRHILDTLKLNASFVEIFVFIPAECFSVTQVTLTLM